MIQDTDPRHLATAYLRGISRLIGEVDIDSLLRVHGYLDAAREAGATIYLAGNGGSAATASHWANDLGKATKRSDARPVRVLSLADHLSWMTALANDEGYDRVFAGQLENFVSPGDVLVVLSASGHSRNLIEAVHTARSRGAITIGLLGFDGGALKSLVHDSIWLPTPRGAYGPVEDAHAVICHVLTECLAHGDVEASVRAAVSGAEVRQP